MLLAPEDIESLARIVVDAHLANQQGRQALWSAIDARLMASVPEAANPGAQVRADLHALARARTAERPFEDYVGAALPLVVQPADQKALEDILARLRRSYDVAEAEAPVATALVAQPVYLRCDREPQWKEATRLLGDPQPYVILVPGADGEAHDYFGERLLKWPDASFSDFRHVLAEWPGGRPPDDRADFRAALWRALGGADDRYDDAAFVDRFRESAGAGLLIVHPCVHVAPGGRAEAVEAYCGEVLPELMAAAGAPRVKIVLPLAWTPNRFVRWWWELLRPDDPWADAPRYVRRIGALGAHVRSLPALEPFDERAIEALFADAGVEKSDRADLATFVTRVTTSLERFSRLKRLFKDRAQGARA